jgi:hypothetical protein
LDSIIPIEWDPTDLLPNTSLQSGEELEESGVDANWVKIIDQPVGTEMDWVMKAIAGRSLTDPLGASRSRRTRKSA